MILPLLKNAVELCVYNVQAVSAGQQVFLPLDVVNQKHLSSECQDEFCLLPFQFINQSALALNNSALRFAILLKVAD
jgi:hypothetical protein